MLARANVSAFPPLNTSCCASGESTCIHGVCRFHYNEICIFPSKMSRWNTEFVLLIERLSKILHSEAVAK